MTIFSLFLACNPIELQYSSETQGCQNWDPSATTESSLNIYYEGEDLIIQRTGVLQHCKSDFNPIIDQQGSYKLTIREFWDASDTDLDCETTCFSPTVRLTSYPNRALEFWWYIGDNPISFDVIDTDQAEELEEETE